MFGLLTTGVCASYVYLCICRDELECEITNPDDAGQAIVDLYGFTGVAHGDGWVRNVLMVKMSKQKHQVIDFERSFIPNPNSDPEVICRTSREYASASTTRRADLVKVIGLQGLNRTRKNFINMANEIMSGRINLFDYGIDNFKSVFELL